MHVCMYVVMYVYVYVCMYVCMYIGYEIVIAQAQILASYICSML